MSLLETTTRRCDICGELRPVSQIGVRTVDVGPKDLPAGLIARNVLYCKDNPACQHGAETWQEKL